MISFRFDTGDGCSDLLRAYREVNAGDAVVAVDEQLGTHYNKIGIVVTKRAPWFVQAPFGIVVTAALVVQFDNGDVITAPFTCFGPAEQCVEVTI